MHWARREMMGEVLDMAFDVQSATVDLGSKGESREMAHRSRTLWTRGNHSYLIEADSQLDSSQWVVGKVPSEVFAFHAARADERPGAMFQEPCQDETTARVCRGTFLAMYPSRDLAAGCNPLQPRDG